jgi:hypothetical protein
VNKGHAGAELAKQGWGRADLSRSHGGGGGDRRTRQLCEGVRAGILNVDASSVERDTWECRSAPATGNTCGGGDGALDSAVRWLVPFFLTYGR